MIRRRLIVLALLASWTGCKPGPSEPRLPSLGDPDYLACPRGTSPWGHGPVNPIRWWCELPDGGLQGPYVEWWPSATVSGQLGPQAEGPRVKGWFEQGQRAGPWTYFFPDGGVERTEPSPIPRR